MFIVNHNFNLEIGWTKIIKTKTDACQEDMKECGFVEFKDTLTDADAWLLYLKQDCPNCLKYFFHREFKSINIVDDVEYVVVSKEKLDEFRTKAFKILSQEIVDSKCEKNGAPLILIDLANTVEELVEAIAIVGIFYFNKETQNIGPWSIVISAKMRSLCHA
jgi:hypothetical protein